MSLSNIADQIDATSFSTALKMNFWVVPTLQSIHILSVCLVLTSAVVVALRSWHLLGMDWSPALWARRLYPPQWWALLVLLGTGVLQVLAEPTRELPNAYFQAKMVGVIAAALLTLWMTRQFSDVDLSKSKVLAVRLTSMLLVLLWLAIIFAGRWIAYA